MSYEEVVMILLDRREEEQKAELARLKVATDLVVAELDSLEARTVPYDEEPHDDDFEPYQPTVLTPLPASSSCASLSAAVDVLTLLNTQFYRAKVLQNRAEIDKGSKRLDVMLKFRQAALGPIQGALEPWSYSFEESTKAVLALIDVEDPPTLGVLLRAWAKGWGWAFAYECYDESLEGDVMFINALEKKNSIHLWREFCISYFDSDNYRGEALYNWGDEVVHSLKHAIGHTTNSEVAEMIHTTFFSGDDSDVEV